MTTEREFDKIVVLDEVQARWLSDLSRAAHNYKTACALIADEADHEFARVDSGVAPSGALGSLAMGAQMHFGAVRALLTQKWSIFLVANWDEDSKEQAILEVNRFAEIALGPVNTKSIKSLDGFTWFKRGFTLDNF